MPSFQFHVRPATVTDIHDLILLRRSMYEAMDVPATDLDDAAWQIAFTEWVEARVDDPNTLIAVAEIANPKTNDAMVVACSIGEVTSLIPGPQFATGRVGLVSNVSTIDGYRGEGMGAACTDAVLKWLTDIVKVDRIDLFATAEGEPIYLRRGFTRRRFPAMVRPRQDSSQGTS